MTDKQPGFKLLKNNEEIFDFKSLAPANTEFKFNWEKKWEADDKGRPLVSYHNFTGVKDILSFLHEFGHLNNQELGARARKSYQDFAAEAKKDKHHGQPVSWLKALREKRQAYLPMEQAAWDFAVNTVRELEKRFNINIISRLGSEADLDKFIKYNINTYRQGYIDLIDESSVRTDSDLEDYFESVLDKPGWPERKEERERQAVARRERDQAEWAEKRRLSA